MNWARVSKTLSVWILLILIPFAFIKFSGARSEPAPTITYSEYDAQLTRGNIEKVNIQAGKQITGEFRDKVVVNKRPVSRFNVRLPVADSEKEVERLREANVTIEAQDARPSILGTLGYFLPDILFLGIWLFIFKQMQAGGSKAFSFGKSKAKLLTGDTPKVTFADVAGADEAKVELQEII